jgi:hypothetical protein
MARASRTGLAKPQPCCRRRYSPNCPETYRVKVYCLPQSGHRMNVGGSSHGREDLS